MSPGPRTAGATSPGDQLQQAPRQDGANRPAAAKNLSNQCQLSFADGKRRKSSSDTLAEAAAPGAGCRKLCRSQSDSDRHGRTVANVGKVKGCGDGGGSEVWDGGTKGGESEREGGGVRLFNRYATFRRVTGTKQPDAKGARCEDPLFVDICWSISRVVFFLLVFVAGVFIVKYITQSVQRTDEIEDLKDDLHDQRELAATITKEIRDKRKIKLLEYYESDVIKPGSRERRSIPMPEDGDVCEYGRFRLVDMDECESWLGCKAISEDVDVDKKHVLGQGMTKLVYLGKWRNRSVVVSFRNKRHRERFQDFSTNIANLKAMQSPDNVVALVGWCNDKMLVTEYHERGTLRDLMQSEAYLSYSLTQRYNLALEYAKRIDFFHTGGPEPRIYCDSNKLDGTTKQYLLTHDDKLLISDLDDVPKVPSHQSQTLLADKITPLQNQNPHGLTSCAHTDFLYNRSDILAEGFLAPEQSLNADGSYPLFDHRSDIFKLADVVVHIVTGGNYAEPRRPAKGTKVVGVPGDGFLEQAVAELYDAETSELARVLRRCRRREPRDRPSAWEVVRVLDRLVKSGRGS